MHVLARLITMGAINQCFHCVGQSTVSLLQEIA
ncbi:hypothetical protein EMIT0P44_340056 [Pseudomonas sp. IT-P44]